MQPLDPEAESLLREWIEKADADLEVARRMAAEAADRLRIREIVGFHCQQAAEKYLKALLTLAWRFAIPATPPRCCLAMRAKPLKSRAR